MLLNISINNTARSFVIGGWNELCSGIGKHNILSADECRRIAKVVNLPFMEMHQPYIHWPPACLQANAWNQISFNFGSMPKGNHIFWNPQQTGEQNPKAKPICRVHGKYTILYCTFHHVIIRICKMCLIMMSIHSIGQKEINGLGGCNPKYGKRCGDYCEMPDRRRGWCNVAEQCTLFQPKDCGNDTKPAAGKFLWPLL